MKNKLIISRSNKPTLVNLDAIGEGEDLSGLSEPLRRLFSLCVQDYLEKRAKEFLISPQADHNYKSSFLMKDGSRSKLVPPPPYFIPKILGSFKEGGFMDYDPYSDKEQTGIFEARYKGKDYSLELCVRHAKYGKEIVVRKPAKEAVKEAI